MTGMPKKKLWAMLPLLAFVLVAGIGAVALMWPQGNGHVEHVGKQAPGVTGPLMAGGFLSEADWRGRLTMVNFFASWCVPCRAENDFFLNLKAEGLQRVGIAYKDKKDALTNFLQDQDPYDRVALDDDGKAAIEWGVTGVPETFLVGPDMTILAHHSG